MMVEGDGQHIEEIIAWLVANVGPRRESYMHPLRIYGDGWDMVRQLKDPVERRYTRKRFTHYRYDVDIDDRDLEILFAMRWG